MSLYLKKIISSVLIVALVLGIVSCSKPFSDDEILCDYEEMNCLYYVKDEFKKYKYSDYIFDDVSSGMYKKSTPNIADYRTGNGILDYDIEGYVKARMDFAIKTDLIKKYEMEVDKICAMVRDDYFEQRNSHIYFYDKNKKTSTLLYDGEVTNLSYDDEVPTVMFDITTNDTKKEQEVIEGRRMMLSDIIAANSTIEGYMKVILGTGKERLKFYMDQRIDNDELYREIATMSNAGK
ncbi:MAG: hypothetical protein J6P02_00155 [Lachnospiraceae bacterium]|nr:hypothetical protein [Lachnospiraceae bacterium]